MRRPCTSCPWRLGVVGERDIPGWGPAHAANLARSCRDDGMRVMACHGSTVGDELPCAGFVVQVGFESIGLRILAVRGRFRPEGYDADGIELHADFEAMLEAHGVELPLRNRVSST